jgi:hypothetical protein
MVNILQRLRILAAVPLLFAAGVPANEHDGLLVPHSAEYKVKISVLGGKLTTQLEETPDGYRASSMIRATGLSRIIAHGEISETSEFAVTPDGIRPRHFVSDDGITREKETVDFTFDWDTDSVSGQWNGEPFENHFDGLMHDRVSLQYGLMHDLAKGIHRDEYFLQDAEKFKPLKITNIGTRSVKVPFGQFEAIGIQHQQEGSSRTTTLWVVEELGYLPVIIEQRRKGKIQVRAVLESYAPVGNS